MTRRVRQLRDIGVLVVAGATVTSLAAQSGFSRTVLQDHPLIVTGRHGVSARADFAPGAAAGFHSHPGEEFGYIVDGTIEVTVSGASPAVYRKGEVFFIPPGVPHNGRNVGTEQAALLSVFVLEDGKPLTTPVSRRVRQLPAKQ